MAVRSSPSKSAADDRKVGRIFRRYYRTRAVSLRNHLTERFLPLVHRQAERVGRRLPALVQSDDLVNAGVLGLMEAIESFDPDADVRFETFSAMRIWGAMIDELR